MDYFDIGRQCNRFSFESKISMLNRYSSKLINFSKNIVNIDINLPLPWELETLLTFFINSKEYPVNNLKDIDDNKFINMINSIKDYIPSKIIDNQGEELLSKILISSSQQFEAQEFAKYIFYRYNYFFSFSNEFINMNDLFVEKFEIPYSKFLEFAIIIDILYQVNLKEPKYFRYVFEKYQDVINYLLISREDYITKINLYTDNIEMYSIGIKPCNSYPFIKDKDKIYLPLPHCIIPAITHSLFLRLTDGNNGLKTLFGKKVYESYLFNILNEGNIFDETLEENKYGKDNNKTSDVMCRKEDKYVFFEAKSMVPYFDTRCLNQKNINNEIEKITSAIKQVYNQINLFAKGKYYFFKEKFNVEKDNCYGIVVLLKESYISRKRIYDEYAIKENICIDSEEYKWLINHIKVVSIYDVERYAFTSSSIIDCLIKQIANGEPFNHCLLSPEKTKITNVNLLKFINENTKTLKSFREKLDSI